MRYSCSCRAWLWSPGVILHNAHICRLLSVAGPIIVQNCVSFLRKLLGGYNRQDFLLIKLGVWIFQKHPTALITVHYETYHLNQCRCVCHWGYSEASRHLVKVQGWPYLSSVWREAKFLRRGAVHAWGSKQTRAWQQEFWMVLPDCAMFPKWSADPRCETSKMQIWGSVNLCKP